MIRSGNFLAKKFRPFATERPGDRPADGCDLRPCCASLNLTPGTEMLFCLGQGARSGPRVGVAAAFGIATGAFAHSLMAGLGLAAKLAFDAR